MHQTLKQREDNKNNKKASKRWLDHGFALKHVALSQIRTQKIRLCVLHVIYL